MMDTATTMLLFVGIHAMGLALWSSLAALNNLQDFRGAAAAVGRTLSMTALDTPPVVPTPLRRRAVHRAGLHRAALVVVLALELCAAAALWTGCAQLLLGAPRDAVLPWLNLGLVAVSAALLAMLLGGMAVAYWVREEGLQLTHLVLLLWTLAAFGLFNHGWAAGV